MREVRCGTDEENGVAIDEARDGSDGDTVGGRRAGDVMKLDFEVGGCFMEGSMCSFGDDPGLPVSQNGQTSNA